MNTARSNAGWELIWWIALVAIAGGLALLMTSPLLAAAPVITEPRVEQTAPAAPRMLGPLQEAWARAVDDFRCGEPEIARQELAVALDDIGQDGPVVPGNLALSVWRILLDHATGQGDRAIAGWHHVLLPPRMDVWRHVALASAYLETGQLEAAADAINAGWEIDAQHPLLHYYRGLLLLEEAAAQGIEFYDAAEQGPTRLASYRPPTVMPNSASMYRLVASMQIERAIEHAGAVVRHEPLVPVQPVYESRLTPTVDDLLAAIGADRFEGDAHHVLGDLFLERGNAELAEEHFDAATGAGVRVIFGYGELAAYYESHQRSLDAARAFAKELRSSPAHGSAGWRMLANLSRAMWSW